jgi:hypothetical protein
MQVSQLKAGQLDAYLDSLTPKAAAFLIREVERDKLKGGSAYPHDLILQRVRALVHDTVERFASPVRVFCAPFEDMLVDVSSEAKHKARITRSSVDAIWTWLATELAPDAAQRLTHACPSGEPMPEDAVLSQSLGGIYGDLAAALQEQLDGLEAGAKPYLRIAGRLGGDAVLEDAIEIRRCLAVAGDLLAARARMPEHIAEIRPSDVPLYVALYTEFHRRHPGEAYMLAASILERTTRVADALQVACAVAGTQDSAILETHHIAVVFDAVLHDMEVACQAARRAIIARADMGDIEAHLKTFHALASTLEDIVELAPRGRWASRLVTLRARLSATIKETISAAPRLVKAALFPKSKITAGGVAAARIAPPDARNVADAQFAVGLLVATRYFLDQLSTNAEYSRVMKLVEQFMEAVAERILREMRRTDPEDRDACIAFMDAAGRMIQTLYGEEACTLYLRRGRAASAPAEEADGARI